MPARGLGSHWRIAAEEWIGVRNDERIAAAVAPATAPFCLPLGIHPPPTFGRRILSSKLRKVKHLIKWVHDSVHRSWGTSSRASADRVLRYANWRALSTVGRRWLRRPDPLQVQPVAGAVFPAARRSFAASI